MGGFSTVAAMVLWFGWGLPHGNEKAHVDPTRADYIDLLLTMVTILLGAIGLAVTVGALVIGLVALKTLREIKTEAATEAKIAAGNKIAAELAPSVDAKVREALPAALPSALMNDDLADKILTEMAGRGELDAVLERVVARLQGGPTDDPEQPDDN
ncbi:hypothetical protein [Paracoccus hibiscisoli]|uniref:Uncharacterized protein n=1 Tax=Paracoccus hibiscisoli TaxID=2023261 RepID=A0A4V5MTZ5_9RHOB|nr:hypothetical protein [Paracoccus hibiscisoli]TJZ86178.1 hypothetical protein FA740_04630 [Paracoccus hibiscisoli]